MREKLQFPPSVDEVSARLVAAGVVALTAAVLLVQEGWLFVPLVYGFAARVAAGPTLSPLGRIVTRGIRPRLPIAARPVPGPPKRFAQAIGLAFTGLAAASWWVGLEGVSITLLAILMAAASLEAFGGVCLGCIAYRFFWECDDCADISERLAKALAHAGPATN